MDGLKRPRDEGDAAACAGDEEEDLVTMMDVFQEQKALEEEAMHKEHEEWGDEQHCTSEKVCYWNASFVCETRC